ncbi:hypothetical protein [Burkholderia pyrrocinia]|uniref:hypothetical protein n=1 Tax=Burkholderia pyrrocinia TaxID=60550 RepID=UPI001FC88840|nr:hypothetical protein [Burkholderia pyrrocinia]
MPAVLQVAWAGTTPAPDSARKTPVGNSSLGNGSPVFFERARFMLSLNIGFGIAAAPDGTQQKIANKGVHTGGRNATSAYS